MAFVATSCGFRRSRTLLLRDPRVLRTSSVLKKLGRDSHRPRRGAARPSKRLFGDLPALFKNEDELRALWSQPDTRQERADASRPFITAHYDPKLQAFLDFVLSQYVSEGVGELDQAKLPHLLELRYRAISDAA